MRICENRNQRNQPNLRETFPAPPFNPDTDGDELSDGYELEISHTDPLRFDTDGDGLVDSIDPHPLTSDGDCYGQSDAWVAATFTNAAEILEVGYTNWVNAQVGVGLTNGLYKFVATFTEVPLECVNLTVGELSVAVTNAGDYVFLLEKGRDYRFGTSPYSDSLEWSAVDDLGGGEPAPASVVDWGSQATWTVDGGWLNLTLPAAPNDGLVISRGTTVAMEVDCEPTAAAALFSSQWTVRRMRGNGSFSAWEDAGSETGAVAHLYTPSTGGIYQVCAVVSHDDSFTVERFFLWGEEEDTYGSRKKGDIKAFGVVDEEWQKVLRNTAKAMLGETIYGLKANLPSGYGFSGVNNDWKCNQFVARMICQSGLTVPRLYGKYYKRYPPLANDWANGTSIEGWQWLGRDIFIQPGFVIGHPASDGPGHCGIIDFDGEGIAAGTLNVNRKESKWHDGTSGYNKWRIQQQEDENE